MLIIGRIFRLSSRKQDMKIVEKYFKELGVVYFDKKYLTASPNENDIHFPSRVYYNRCSCSNEIFDILCKKLNEAPVVCFITEGVR